MSFIIIFHAIHHYLSCHSSLSFCHSSLSFMLFIIIFHAIHHYYNTRRAEFLLLFILLTLVIISLPLCRFVSFCYFQSSATYVLTCYHTVSLFPISMIYCSIFFFYFFFVGSSFSFQFIFLSDHYCLVFETLGISIYDLIKRNDYTGFPLNCVRDLAR